MTKCLSLAYGLGLTIAAFLAHLLAPHLQVEARYKPGEYEAAKDSIAVSLLGQLRMSVGDMMWLKTLEYLHNGVIYRMPTKREESQGIHDSQRQRIEDQPLFADQPAPSVA